MTPPTGLEHKGEVVEEWIDLHFFRPLGMRLVRRLAPTAVTADQLTMVALGFGLLAGHLFFYRSAALNLAGLALFIISDIFDSADGQLARLRGSSTRFGRILDGLADNARFVNLYLHLMARLVVAHAMPVPAIIALGLAAGYSHSMQSGVADYLRQVWLYLTGSSVEFDLPEDLAAAPDTARLSRIELGIYRTYIARQARWCAHSTALARAVRQRTAPAGLAQSWRRVQAVTVGRCALIAQNVRFLLLGITVCLGWVTGFFWLTLLPLNLVLVWLLVSHERAAAGLARARELVPGVVVAGEA